MLILKNRFKRESRPGGFCGSHYCSGHSDTYLIDEKTGKETLWHGEIKSDTLNLINFIIESIEEENVVS